jgi:hypothetical protein
LLLVNKNTTLLKIPILNSNRYINANAARLRGKFVDHEGQIELKASAEGTLATANYDELISQISDSIDEHTKGSWSGVM